MHHHSRLRHKWRKLLRERRPMVFVTAAVILTLIFMAGLVFLLSSDRFRPQ